MPRIRFSTCESRRRSSAGGKFPSPVATVRLPAPTAGHNLPAPVAVYRPGRSVAGQAA